MALGSGIRKKPIPDPGSRIQGSKRHRIPDPDPQHWLTLLYFSEMYKISYILSYMTSDTGTGTLFVFSALFFSVRWVERLIVEF
jgi:hypothetical protein